MDGESLGVAGNPHPYGKGAGRHGFGPEIIASLRAGGRRRHRRQHRGFGGQQKGATVFAEDCIRNYTGTQVKNLLEEGFSLPTAVENDLEPTAALGEGVSWRGKRR